MLGSASYGNGLSSLLPDRLLKLVEILFCNDVESEKLRIGPEFALCPTACASLMVDVCNECVRCGAR